jgi:hypothetical protein
MLVYGTHSIDLQHNSNWFGAFHLEVLSCREPEAYFFHKKEFLVLMLGLISFHRTYTGLGINNKEIPTGVKEDRRSSLLHRVKIEV